VQKKKSVTIFDETEKTKLVLISGVPGAGKGTLGLTLNRLLNNEALNSVVYNPPVE